MGTSNYGKNLYHLPGCILKCKANVSKSTAKKHTKLVLLAGSCVDRVSWQFRKIS